MKTAFERIIVVGSGKFTLECALRIKNIFKDVQVYEYTASSISVLKELCNVKGIAHKPLDKKHMDEELEKDSQESKILIVSAFNTYLFKKSLVEKDSVVIINYHNAYLPYHPGRNAEAWCIYENDKTSGVTWHYVSEDVDAGNIIIKKQFEISDDITSIQLLQQQTQTGYELFDQFIDRLICEGLVEGQIQKDFKKERMHYSYDVPNEGQLDLSWDIDKMYRFLRAMDYGKINLMGVPEVWYGMHKFDIVRYKLRESGEYCDSVYIDNNKMHVIKGGKELILTIKDCGGK